MPVRTMTNAASSAQPHMTSMIVIHMSDYTAYRQQTRLHVDRYKKAVGYINVLYYATSVLIMSIYANNAI